MVGRCDVFCACNTHDLRTSRSPYSVGLAFYFGPSAQGPREAPFGTFPKA